MKSIKTRIETWANDAAWQFSGALSEDEIH